MCVIAYAPPGVSIMDACIEKMFSHNSDGAGIMYKPVDGSDIVIRKGFMKVDDLKDAWSKIPVECEKAIHCRIATSGMVSAECCHPFPIREYAEQMKRSEDAAPLAFMHNGVFRFCEPKAGMDSTYSDSMLFASRYLYKLRDKLDDPNIQGLLDVVADESASKLLIFNKNAKAVMLGDWREKDGVYYSNLNHEYFYGRGLTCTSSCGYGLGNYYSRKKKKKNNSDDAVEEIIDNYGGYYTITLNVEREINEATQELIATVGNDYTPEDIKSYVEDAVYNALGISTYGGDYWNDCLVYYDSGDVDIANATFVITVWSDNNLVKKDIESLGLTVLNLVLDDDYSYTGTQG